MLSSKFITYRKSRSLIEKLIKLTKASNAAKLHRTVHVTGKAKSENEKGYSIVDAINEAIHSKCKLSFYYFDYDNRKKHVLKNDGKPYTVSPYDLLYDGETFTWFEGRRIDNPNTHGTGCTLSSAIAANLAKGYSLSDAYLWPMCHTIPVAFLTLVIRSFRRDEGTSTGR